MQAYVQHRSTRWCNYYLWNHFYMWISAATDSRSIYRIGKRREEKRRDEKRRIE